MTANPLSTIPPIGPTTGVPQTPMQGKFKPIDPVRLLRQHLPLLIVAGMVGLIIGGAAWALARKYSPEFASSAKLAASGSPDRATDIRIGSTDSYELPEIETFIRNQMAVIMSDDLLLNAIDYPTVRNTRWFAQFDGDVRLAAKALAEDHLRLSPQRASTLLTMTVRMANPMDAQIVLDALIEVYLSERRQELEGDTTLLQNDQMRERERYTNELDALTRRREAFIRDNDLATLEVARSEAGVAYDTMNKQRIVMLMELNAAQSSIQGLLQASQEAPDRPMSEAEEQALRMLQPVAMREEQIRFYNEQIRKQEAMGMLPGHRMMREMQEQLASVEQELDQLMRVELRKYREAQVANAVQMQEQISEQLSSMEEKSLELHANMRDMTEDLAEYESTEAEIERLRDQLTLVEQNLADLRQYRARRDVTRIRIAVTPTEGELVSPMWYVWIPGVTMLTLAMVSGLIFLRELTDQRVKSPADIKLLNEATLLGVLPDASEDPSGQVEVKRIVEKAPTGLFAESFRQVRTAVLSRMDRRGYKTIVLVAAQPEAGTSSVAQNLAASLAYNGRKVLIIDSNFRRPSQHLLADISNERGLVDVLREEMDADEAIYQHPDLSLSVLVTGQAAEAPPELLEGPTFRSLLGRMESEYDVVIIDAPPALLTSDSQLLAKHVDAIAVVVRSGTDKRGMVERMLAKLDGQRADVLGIVLNGVKSSAGGYFRKSYEDFYSYRRGGEVSESTPRNGHANGNGKKREAVTADESSI